MDQNIYEGLKKNLRGAKPENGVVYLKSSITGETREIAFALKYGEWCYTKAYGDQSYEKKKTDVCEVPVDYLFIDSSLYSLVETLENENFFLWREEDTTKAIQRKQIESIEIKPSDKVSENAIYSWDVSENKTGKVMAWYEDVDKDGYYEVYIGQNGGVKAKNDATRLFAYLSNATNIDLKYLDTSQVTDMHKMFQRNNNLTALILNKGIDTSNVSNMNSMFDGCKALKMLDVSNFDISKIENINYLFNDCSSLMSIDLSKWNTSGVTSMHSLFSGCSSLTTLNLSNFDTSNVTNMTSMFSGCSSLTSIDLSKFDTSKVTTMEGMFKFCGVSNVIYKTT